MALSAGTRLGHYEVIAPLGAGGMGEVYRARDTRLGRDVAIKVMPEHLAAQPELRARFEREARTASSLNHPNICTLHDIGREGETDFIVMELVEGESLAQRLVRGALPTAEALRIAIEISDALEKAHRAGIVHRDLKPGNIMLGKTGAKLMDFGLARATGLAPAPGSSALSHTPTATRGLTREGSIVGTFQYMAPEQLEGGEADARTDVWALGAVLYEMSTGAKAFAGSSQASLIAAILKDTPRPVSQVQPLAPPALDRLIQACLAKDPEQRVQTAHDVRLQLQWIAEGGSQAGVPAPVAARRRRNEGLAWAVAAIAGAVAIALGAWSVLRRPEPPRVLRFEIGAPAGASAIRWPQISPDGRLLTFLANDSAGVSAIWLRSLDAIEAHRLPGTEGAGRPFWSPDSRFLDYIAEGKLRKVPVSGGPPVVIAETPGGFDGTWGAGNVILYDGAAGDSIRGVPASGGNVRIYTTLDRKVGDSQHAWPSFLPDGHHFLYVASVGSSTSRGVIRVGDTGSGRTITLGQTDGRVQYVPQGFLVYTLDGNLLAQPFDAGRLATIGDPVPVGENIDMGNAAGYFSASPAGMLAYSSQRQSAQSQLQWFDRTGRPLGTVGAPGGFHDIAISPDGTRVLISITDRQKNTDDIWVRQVSNGITSRLTFDPAEDINPIWSPDGQSIAWASNSVNGTFRTRIRLASGAGEMDSLRTGIAYHEGPVSWSRDGRSILVRALTPTTSWDIERVPLPPGQKMTPVVSTPFVDTFAEESPDGRWLAYQTNESGRNEVYVVPMSGGSGKWQVSSSGGISPHWRADGRELFYRSPGDQTIYSVPINAGASFESGTPVRLFQVPVVESNYNGWRWQPTRDGQRFLVNTPLQGPERQSFTVVTNWTQELKRR
jgi:Tol biopolymer transport system component